MTQAVTYERETKSVAFQGKIIVLESLTPVLSPKEKEQRKKEIERRLYDVFSKYGDRFHYLRLVFPAYGVRFIAITDNIDTAQESSGDDLTVSVKNIMNEAYCRDISVKTRTSLDVKRRNGDFVGAFKIGRAHV